MPLSDRAKTYLVASAVVVVAAGNVLFGLSRTTPSVPAAVPVAVTAVEAPAPPPVQAAPAPIREAPVPVAAEPPPPPKCDAAACAAAYHSFKESDCMFQPNVGPRRLCTKGKPPL
jgi:hypothetical protein